MNGVQHSNDDDACSESDHEIAGFYHRAAVHEYTLGRHEEAQRLAGLALDHRAKAHACLLRASQTMDLAEAGPEKRQASVP